MGGPPSLFGAIRQGDLSPEVFAHAAHDLPANAGTISANDRESYSGKPRTSPPLNYP
jgi:hypothetical protein